MEIIKENTEVKKESILDKENFESLKWYFHQLIKNFWEINNEDNYLLESNTISEDFLISNFKKILKRRVENWENWVLFLIKNMEKNDLFKRIFKEDFLFAKKILDTNWKIFNLIK